MTPQASALKLNIYNAVAPQVGNAVIGTPMHSNGLSWRCVAAVGSANMSEVAMERLFTRIANYIAHATGTPLAFIICVVTVIAWAISGPMFGYSDTWQLVINTGTTIITFLMVFLIQNTQNRDATAFHAKLDELIRVGKAQNSFIGIEHLTEDELEAIRETCERAAKRHDQTQQKQ